MKIIKFLSFPLPQSVNVNLNRTKQRRTTIAEPEKGFRAEFPLAKYIKGGLFIVFLIKNRIAVYSNKAKDGVGREDEKYF
jgi:hypothetical protein